MRLVAKSMEKVVIEITTNEIEKKGFEFFWDKIRRTYKAAEYDVDSIGASRDNEKIIFIELKSKRFYEDE
ncbi:MAG: hypothetical protein AABY15_05600 [Nanoarchaeota archaeon]